jgi:hypothetical protein
LSKIHRIERSLQKISFKTSISKKTRNGSI